MKTGEIITELHTWIVCEDDHGANPAFLLNQEDDNLQAALDIVERMKLHLEDVINYRQDMEEYADVANG